MPRKNPAKDISAALRTLHISPEWSFFEEVTDEIRRFDAFAMNLWSSRRYERVAYEVKMTRQDFKRELDDPIKRRAGLLASNRFYFATPMGLVRPEEIPLECGLIEIDDIGRPHQTVHAPWRDVETISCHLAAACMKRAYLEQEAVRVQAIQHDIGTASVYLGCDFSDAVDQAYNARDNWLNTCVPLLDLPFAIDEKQRRGFNHLLGDAFQLMKAEYLPHVNRLLITPRSHKEKAC
jgi:hypothetical protein